MTIYCSKCATALPENAAFCYVCGKPVIESNFQNKTVYFVKMRLSTVGKILVISTNSCDVADMIYGDLETTVQRKNCLKKVKDGKTYDIQYSVVFGFAELKMRQFYTNWNLYFLSNGWSLLQPQVDSEGDYEFIFKTESKM